MANLLEELFNTKATAGVVLNKIEISPDKNNVRFLLSMPRFDTDLISEVETLVRNKFNRRQCHFSYTFPEGSFSQEAVGYVIELLRKGGLPLNGFFKGAIYSYDLISGTLSITLASKCKATLEAANFSELFSEACQRVFSQSVNITMDEPAESHTLPIGDAALSDEAKKELEEKKKLHLFPSDLKACKLDLQDDVYEIVMGNKVNLSHLETIKEAIGDEGRCVISGYLVESDEKIITRRGYTIRNMLITDYTESVYIKSFDKAENYKALDGIKKGQLIAVAGEIKYDDRNHNLYMDPYNIITLHPKKPVDNEPEKRIELHQHTNMSQMDALPSAESVVMRAAQLGHHAVAITDHGGVQAFPDAWHAIKAARELVPDFKVLYGCEVYYVDDSVRAVMGEGSLGIEDEVVCFDLETTGFDYKNDRIIEIGAAVVRDGQICETFDTFVNPDFSLPQKITELTGITDDMLIGAPDELEAIQKFIAFVNGRPVVAHNATFDMSFVSSCCERYSLDFHKKAFCIDTLALSQALIPDIAHHKLDSLTKYFKLSSFNHHRGSDDAVQLGKIYLKLIELLKAEDIKDYSEVNKKFVGRNIKHGKLYHMIIIAKDLIGLKNLYTLVSVSNVKYFHGKPRVPLSEILAHREGLIIGSACEAGEVYRAVLENRDDEYIDSICEKYDYFEIQPRCNNMFLVREGNLKDEQGVLDVNKRIVALADRLGKPCVATCDVHFLDDKDAIYRKILLTVMGFSDADQQAPLKFRTTREMLDEFSYLGEEKAREVVITNPALIASWCEPDIRPIPDGTFNPSIEGSEEQITDRAMAKIKELYGDNPDSYVVERAKKELDSICSHGYAVLYLIAQKLVDKSESDGYHVGSRGSVGSSYVAFLLGISEVNPLPVHYRCPNCKHFEYTDAAPDGFDLPEKLCPECGTLMEGDGHNIPFETFLGFKGDKCPDIDLNFSSEYQNRIFKYTEELFGSDYVFKAGTVMALQDNTAMGYVRKYAELGNYDISPAELRRLALGCTGVKKSTGQHPGGMVVIPNGRDINEFTPVQRPADKTDADFITTHFDFNSLHDTLLKLDELGHEIPTTYHYLEFFSGMNIKDVPTNDRKVIKLFTSPEPLGITQEDIQSETGTYGIPEMGTTTSRNILIEAHPNGVGDLVQISGLSHGTGVWKDNSQDLIRNGTCTISDVIGTRDSIMTTLISYGLENDKAFKIMEFVRKNKNSKPLPDDFVDLMREHNVPEWYIDSCRKIQYMFPKAHAVAYVTSAIKVAWFKVYKPLEFYAAYFSVRGMDTDSAYALGSLEKLRERMREMERINQDPKQRTAKTEDELVSLQMLQELKCRNVEFLPVDVMHSHYKRYEIQDGKLRLPFVALNGVGENAAKALYEAASSGKIQNAEDFLSFPGISQSLLDTLDELGALGSMPKTAQISFW